ncbi:MAG TPA: DUF4255 domain-containing protein [Sorangium sp.]|nr:DUF4255 domain-containing protein [Sorangium sp.]
MANFASISAVGVSIERFLNASFAAEQPLASLAPDPATVEATSAVLVRTEDFDPNRTESPIRRAKHALSIYFYRIELNKTMRASWGAVGHLDGRAHLPVDLHFLLTAWSSNAQSELLILGRAMQALETTPILGGPLLSAAGEFAPNESVQLSLGELSTEAVMRTFDSLPVDYKLSVPYVARVVRIDSRAASASPPVLTTVVGAKPEVIS